MLFEYIDRLNSIPIFKMSSIGIKYSIKVVHPLYYLYNRIASAHNRIHE